MLEPRHICTEPIIMYGALNEEQKIVSVLEGLVIFFIHLPAIIDK